MQSVNLILKVAPSYPEEAKKNRVQGTVSLAAIINTEGRIADLSVISGDPLLKQAAADAVSKWVYKPTLLNGKPVEILTQVDVNFTLTQ